jgi:hypothetical protein
MAVVETQLTIDSEFLRSIDSIDYSLILGLHTRKQEWPPGHPQPTMTTTAVSSVSSTTHEIMFKKGTRDHYPHDPCRPLDATASHIPEKPCLSITHEDMVNNSQRSGHHHHQASFELLSYEALASPSFDSRESLRVVPRPVRQGNRPTHNCVSIHEMNTHTHTHI